MGTTYSPLMITAILLGLSAVIMGAGLLILAIYHIYSNIKKTEDNLTVQLATAKTASNKHIITLQYKDLLEIVNNVINNIIVSHMTTKSLHHKDWDKINIMLDELITDICTEVMTSISSDIKQAIYFYVTEEYFIRYIKDTVMISLVARLGESKRTKHNIG